MKVDVSKEARNELKSIINSGNKSEAMYYAQHIGFYGVAAKLAEQMDEYEYAGEFFRKFGDYNKSLNYYLKSDKSTYLSEILDVAEKTNDSELVLKAITFITESSFSLSKRENQIIYEDFMRGNYEHFENYEQVRKKLALNYAKELDPKKQHYSLIVDLYSEVGLFEELSAYCTREIDDVDRNISILERKKEFLEKYVE